MVYRLPIAFSALLCVLLLLPGAPGGARPVALRIAAAADLRPAFQELARPFERETGATVTFIFGSSGLLAKQAENGAPFDALFSANEAFIADLERKGKILPGTRAAYALGRLAVWTRAGQPHPKALADLAGSSYARIAIANPQHAPYGVAAREALQKAGVWPRVESRIVYGENVQQALQYAQTGNASVAIVAQSLAMGGDGVWTPVPERLYAPIVQGTGVLKGSAAGLLTKRFIAFVRGPKGQAILRRYGFAPPPRGR